MASFDILPTSGFRSIKSAFRRRRQSTGSKSEGSTASLQITSTSPPTASASVVPLPVPNRQVGSPAASSPAVSPSSPESILLATKNYPHVHIKEMVYEACPRMPKHSYEESVADCTCGKRAVGRYREMCGLKDAECPGCKFGFDEPQEESDDEYYY